VKGEVCDGEEDPKTGSMNGRKQSHGQLDEQEARWFAVYTRYKREKLVRQRLAEKGIETYLPLQSFTRHYTRKVRTVAIPLINCYLFTKIVRKEYVRVLETPDLVRFVTFAGELIAIPENEIELLRRVVGEKVDVEAEPLRYIEGDEVEIIGGQLTGLRGTLLKKRSDKNFVIALQSVGYALHIQVDPAHLRKAKLTYR